MVDKAPVTASPGNDPQEFSAGLFQIMAGSFPGVDGLELYEFRYLLDTVTPPSGWASVEPAPPDFLETLVSRPEFFRGVQSKPSRDGKVVMDETVAGLTRTLMAGLACRAYTPEWVLRRFYFDIRSFAFFVRTRYFSPEIIGRFGGRPYRSFERRQKLLEARQDLGYPEFQAANEQIDDAFLDALKSLNAVKGTPMLVTLAGPTAAGKTEITARLQQRMRQAGQRCTTVEFDNFLRDREYRDVRPMGVEVIHFDIFKAFTHSLLHGQAALMPRYDFLLGTSSHDQDGRLRPGQSMITVEPAEIILIEGNFPFHVPEIAPLVGIKAVYLTDDPIRLKRKWRRDVDYRKKYEPMYLCNRFFRTQFLRAEEIYRPMMRICEMVVDTTAAELWILPEIAARLGRS